MIRRPRAVPVLLAAVPLLVLLADPAAARQQDDDVPYGFRSDARSAGSGGRGPAFPEAGTLFLHPERFEREDGTLVTVDRGALFVPVNRSRPEGGVLQVMFWRFRAHEGVPDDRPPIFYLPGGPGFPGLDEELEDPEFFRSEVAPFLDVADVVVMGQRGIGSSRPNTVCQGPPAPPDGAERTADERTRRWRETAADCRRYWEERGLDLQGFTVIESAADVDAVRRALGYDRITIWGVSFGSHWGMAVMRYHPEIVERALLSGTEGPNHTYDDPAGVLAVLERISEDAGDADAFRGRVPEGGFLASLRRTIDRLERQPATVSVAPDEADASVRVTLDGEAIRDLSEGYLGSVGDRRWEASWPLGVLLLADGDLTRAARRLTPPSDPSGGGPWRTASYFMLDCGSGITPEREERLVNDPARDVVGEQNAFYRATCPAWDADLGDDFRRGFETRLPTVVVHGTWDLATPLENALQILPRFRDATFVRVERGSHGALDEALRHSDAFRAALIDFLSTGERGGLPDRVELPEPDWVTMEELKASEP